MKKTWNITIDENFPASIGHYAIDQMPQDNLLISIFAQSWEDLPGLYEKAEADVREGKYDHQEITL